jgi:multidrug efflux pump subunit AcrA (membrane-fusion protein)
MAHIQRRFSGGRTGVLLLLLLPAILILPAACAPSEEDSPRPRGEARAAETGGPPQSRAGGASAEGGLISTARTETRSRMIQVGGRLKPLTSIVHTPSAAGFISELNVKPGDRVAAGSVLFTVDRNEAGQTFRPVPVSARIDGIVSAVDIELEQQVQSGGAGVTLIGTDGYTLEARISDKDAFNVALGQTVQAHTSADAILTGRLSLRSPEPDYATGLFRLTFNFPASRDAFAGVFVLVDLPAEILRGVFVPGGAIDRRYGRSFIWIVDESTGLVSRREVSVGASLGEETLILEGLEEGVRFLTSLTGREREGAPVPGGRS